MAKQKKPNKQKPVTTPGPSKVKLVVPSGADYTGAGAGSLKQVVDSTVRDLLGLGLRDKDPKAVLAALRERFVKKTVEGRTVWEYQPRASATVAATSGILPASQVKLYQLAKEAEATVLPILDGLKPLLSDFDPQNVEAARSLVRSRFTAIVSEFARPYGPREERVEKLFKVLGYPEDDSPVNKGALGSLVKEFGLAKARVNDLKEQQTLTNYEILKERIDQLFRNWLKFVIDSKAGDFSSQAILLQRKLNLTAEAVKQVEKAMDSVSLFASERENIDIDTSVEHPLTLAEGLSWIESFADEMQRTLEASGKRGVAASKDEFVSLLDFVALVQDYGERNEDAIDARFADEDVTQSITTLKNYLNQAQVQADEIAEDHAEEIAEDQAGDEV